MLNNFLTKSLFNCFKVSKSIETAHNCFFVFIYQEGAIALHEAVKQGHLSVVTALLSKGSSFSTTTRVRASLFIGSMALLEGFYEFTFVNLFVCL